MHEEILFLGKSVGLIDGVGGDQATDQESKDDLFIYLYLPFCAACELVSVKP
jgi:hypothetical protein